LREVFARKRRAVQNLRKLENIIKGEDSGPSRSPLVELKQLSDDEICELALLMERYTWSVAIKWIFGEFIERVSRRGEGYSLLSTVDHYEFPDGFIFPTKPTPQTRRDFGDDQIIQDLIYPYPDE
jgi:hypothetical protein